MVFIVIYQYNEVMKILITGAHFTTAVAVIEELKKQQDVALVYVGRKTTREGDSSPSPESKVIPELNVKFIPITTGRLQRSFTLYTIPSLLKIPIGLIQAFFILLNEKPNVILSFGGYVAVPLVIWGWLMSIPVIIHEQTLVTGLTNKISSWFATKILTSYDVKNDFPKNKVILTGNPLRKEILEAKSKAKSDKPLIFITGGNQGSHVINEAVENILPELKKLGKIVHQTGDSKFQDFERLEKLSDENYQVSKFIYTEMPSLLKSADLVISRAGINTLTELAYFGTPTIVIPVPYLYSDEQTKNAKYFSELGLVKILPQSKLNGNSLLDLIKESLKDEKFKISAKNARSVVSLDAAKKIALETLLTK